MCLWTDSLLSNGAFALLCDQSTVRWKRASNGNFKYTAPPVVQSTLDPWMHFLVWSWDARKERSNKRLRRKIELWLESEVGG